MDASQYKDYVLVMLFVKCVSDKYAGTPFAPVTIPEGASCNDMVALKGTSDIGDNPGTAMQRRNVSNTPHDRLLTFAFRFALRTGVIHRLDQFMLSVIGLRADNIAVPHEDSS